MIYKGVVIGIEKYFAVVLTDQMEYYDIRKKKGLLCGQKVMFVAEDIYNNGLKTFQRMAKMAAVFIVLLLSACFLLKTEIICSFDYQVALLLSMDINPSVQLEINKEQRVLSITPINKESQKIITDDLAGKEMKDVVLSILIEAKDQGYFNTDSKDILLTFNIIDERYSPISLAEDLSQAIEGNTKLMNLCVTFLESDSDDLNNAKKNGISVGRQAMFRIFRQAGENITLEEVRITEIGELLSRCANKKINGIMSEEKETDVKREVDYGKQDGNEKKALDSEANDRQYMNQSEKKNENNKNEFNGEYGESQYKKIESDGSEPEQSVISTEQGMKASETNDELEKSPLEEGNNGSLDENGEGSDLSKYKLNDTDNPKSSRDKPNKRTVKSGNSKMQ